MAVFYWRISPAQKAFSFLVPGCLILVTFCEGIGKEVTCERTVNSSMRDLHSKGMSNKPVSKLTSASFCFFIALRYTRYMIILSVQVG